MSAKSQTPIESDTPVYLYDADRRWVNWRDIAAANNIANPDLIYPGQVFVITN